MSVCQPAIPKTLLALQLSFSFSNTYAQNPAHTHTHTHTHTRALSFLNDNYARARPLSRHASLASPLALAPTTNTVLSWKFPTTQFDFSILQYNLLAGIFATEEKFPYASDAVRLWANRWPRILSQIESVMPSILCLEELQFCEADGQLNTVVSEM